MTARIAALLLAFWAVGLVSPQVVAQGATKHIEITGSQRLRINYDTSFTWPGGSGESAVMTLPCPPNTGGQRIDSFTSSLKGAVQTDEQGHRVLMATIHPSGDRRVHWHVEITGTFLTRQLVDGPPAPNFKPTGAPGAGEFLASTESINWKGADFQEWLDLAGLRRHSGESAVDFGQRVFDYLRHHGGYSYPPSSAWNSAAVCRHLHTDCGGFSLVFTAACRANHVPARLLVGQNFKAREVSGGHVVMTEGRQAHVVAEFFDPQIGWIPEDVSSTFPFLRVRGYPDLNFFGRDPGFFFAWHTDTDFHFNTPRKSDAHVQWIQNPNLWFSEGADDANDSLSHRWDIEKL